MTRISSKIEEKYIHKNTIEMRGCEASEIATSLVAIITE